MFKEIKEKLKKRLEEKTSPDAPLFTGRMIEIALLRLLLSVLVYVLITKFIIDLKVWQFLLIDALLYVTNGFVNLFKKK